MNPASSVVGALLLRAVLLLLVGSVTSAAPAGRPPVEHFARAPEALRVRLSPAGTHIAYLREFNDRSMLMVYDIERDHLTRIDPGVAVLANGAPKEVVAFEWVSDRRLLMTTEVWDHLYGVSAVDRDGSRRVAISGMEDEAMSLQHQRLFHHEVIGRYFSKEPLVLMLDRHESSPGIYYRPDDLLVDTLTGTSRVVAKNPGEVGGWGLDAQGNVRVGMLSHGELSGVLYRAGDDKAWETVLPLARREDKMRPIGYDAANDRLFVAALTPSKRRTLYTFDMKTKTKGEPLLSHEEYDILPERRGAIFDGLALHGPVFAPKNRSLVGLRYFTEAPRVKWFSKRFAAYQSAIDRALPNTVNIPVELSLDEKRMLWLSFSDQDPGTYYLFDFEKRGLQPIAPRMRWIKPAEMAAMLSVKYTARDGLTLHGYLTVPAGHEPKNLPLVIMPHGGPWVRDTWGFDPLVQLLASRGYGVLQMNYRGSTGYGEELYEAARKEIGGKIQDDIEDAARWAIAAGVADPKRMAIVGGSYGGYSALFALGKTPDLYRCGISINGVTDWLDIFHKRRNDPDYKRANQHWREQIGDPDKDEDESRLKAISPVSFADQIKAPVLVIQGRDDRIVPRRQATLMLEALEAAGQKPERLLVARQGHAFTSERGRNIIFEGIVEFLERHLGEGLAWNPPPAR